MSKFTTSSPRAGLMIIGRWLHQQEIWTTVDEYVVIRQKTLTHTPSEKLLDCFINILAGGHGIVEVNTRVRADRALQRAFGRERCAEQSTVSETLNRCTPATVEQLRMALQEIYRMHSQGYPHDYAKCYQVLDVDMSGMPAGRQGEGVTKGYFSGQKNIRGRQLGRVVASLYDEVVVDRLYNGKTQLDRSLQALVSAAATVLGLETMQCGRTILRVDAGGGRDDDINWMLNEGYQVLVKVKHHMRAAKLARSVSTWYADPKVAGREVGWVETPQPYAKPTRQLAIRKRKKDDTWSYHALVFSLDDAAVFTLARQEPVADPTPDQVLFAVLAAYDLRSGGAETRNKGSKQGLGLTKRNKRCFAAQEMLVLLAQLAHNLLIWVRNLLARVTATFAGYGMLRLVRDVLHIPGRVELDAQGHLLRITLNHLYPFSHSFVQCFSAVMAHDNLSLILGEI